MSEKSHSSFEPDDDIVKQRIDNQFPTGRFVAIESDEVIADADSHRELVDKLASLGKSPNNMRILQSGVEYPAESIILLGLCP